VTKRIHELPKLNPDTHPVGGVLLGISRPETIAGITRFAVLLSHYFKALPVAVHVALGERPQDIMDSYTDLEGTRLFELARTEASKLGYPIRTYTEFASGITQGIRRAAEREQPFAAVLGYPSTTQSPDLVADSVSPNFRWPVVLVKLDDSFVFKRVLVPVQDSRDLESIQPVLFALKVVGFKQLTLLESEESGSLNKSRDALGKLTNLMGFCSRIIHESALNEALPAMAIEAAKEHDLIVMKADSLPERITRELQAPFLIIRGDLRSKLGVR
jgi:hypothetical protein